MLHIRCVVNFYSAGVVTQGRRISECCYVGIRVPKMITTLIFEKIASAYLLTKQRMPS
jgi:hypothetical protein